MVSIHSFSVFPDRVSRMNERFASVGFAIHWEGDLLTAEDPRNPERSVPSRACIYPMLAVEEGGSPRGPEPHVRYHRACHLAQFDPAIHI